MSIFRRKLKKALFRQRVELEIGCSAGAVVRSLMGETLLTIDDEIPRDVARFLLDDHSRPYVTNRAAALPPEDR